VPADATNLKIAVNNALQSWMVRRNKHEANCQQSVHLWDAVAHIAGELYRLPGRRVVLVVSDGKDRGSVRAWKDVVVYAQATGVAVFGMTNAAQSVVSANRVSPWYGRENSFQSLCELSGDIVLLTGNRSLEETLKRFTTMLRERYIVEFPRLANTTGGEHSMTVKIAKGDDNFIRSAGTSVPLPDAAVLSDPTTVPSDPSLTPELGTRLPAAKPH
jgi:hypothetical protein